MYNSRVGMDQHPQGQRFGRANSVYSVPVPALAFTEVACDAIALNHLGWEQAKSYGQTILSLLEHLSMENLIPITVGIIESKKNLKHRLSRIIHFRKPKVIWSLLAILILSTITVTGLSEALSNEQNYKNQENDYFQGHDVSGY